MSKSDKRKGVMVASICNGTVLDHIPPAKLFKVASLLRLQNLTSPITIGNNFKSAHMGTKGLIKVENKFFTDDEINRIALIAPNVHLNIIKDYDVVEKRRVQLPREIKGIVKCPNQKCVTNNEPVETFFVLTNEEKEEIRCHYCGRKLREDQIELC